MTKILIACAKADLDTDRLHEAETVVRACADGAEVVSADAVPWEAILASVGTFDRMYAAVARDHDLLILLETPAGALARGTYAIAQEFVDRRKPIAVVRGHTITAVECVERLPGDDWKAYGQVVTDA